MEKVRTSIRLEFVRKADLKNCKTKIKTNLQWNS